MASSCGPTTSARPAASRNVWTAEARGGLAAAVQEHERRLEPLGLVHRQDPDRVALGLGALDVAVVGQIAAIADPAAQLGDQLVQVAACARDLLEQQLDQVPGVDERALAAAQDERALGEPAVLDELAEQRLVRAPARERRPVEQPRDQRMVVRGIDDTHQIGPRHVEEPRAQRPHARRAVARRGDGGEHVGELVRLAGLEQPIALDERARQAPRAQRLGDTVAVAVGPRQHHAIAEREPVLAAAAGPHRGCRAQRLDLEADRRGEGLATRPRACPGR